MPPDLPLRNLYAGQEAAVRTGHGPTDWFQIGKGVHQGPAYLTHMQSTSWETLGWMKHKLESRLPGEISVSSDMQMTEREKKLKSLLIKVKGEWKSCLKAQHSENEDHGTWSHHFMADRWENSGNSGRLFFWAPKWLQMVTAAMKLRHLLLRRKLMTNVDSILKSRDITLPTKVV